MITVEVQTTAMITSLSVCTVQSIDRLGFPTLSISPQVSFVERIVRLPVLITALLLFMTTKAQLSARDLTSNTDLKDSTRQVIERAMAMVLSDSEQWSDHKKNAKKETTCIKLQSFAIFWSKC